MVVMASNSGTVTLGDIADRLLMLWHLPHFENWARRLAVGIERICLKCVSAVMEGAQRFRERATHLRQLASTERDISIRQQLAAMALRFDQFAEELEELEGRLADSGR